jgi:hypothetical protein
VRRLTIDSVSPVHAIYPGGPIEQHSTKTYLPANRKLASERLQAKTLFTADIFLENGLLNIEGDQFNNDIHIGFQGDQVLVSADGQ